jgi:hypothetical protein
MYHIRIGEAAEFLSLTLHGRQFPDATDYWRANWLTCDVEVAVGAFRGSFGSVIRNEDLGRFLRGLKLLDEQSSGRATLEALDGWLCLDVVRDGRPRLHVDCQLSDGCNALEFHLTMDPTDLSKIVGSLQEICETYPVVGDADAYLSLRPGFVAPEPPEPG